MLRVVQSLALPRVLTPELAHMLGVTRSRGRTETRRGNWQSLGAGVLLTRPDAPTREDWADLGVYLAGQGAAITGWDALRARGIDAGRPPSEVVVLSPKAMNRVVGGVRIRRTQRPYQWTRLGIERPYELTPVASVPRAAADFALDADRNTTMRVASRLVQRRLCTAEQLRAEYVSGPRNRSAGLRRSINDLLDGARSVAEATAARRLAAGEVPAFELNVPVIDASGRVRFVLDECWRALRAAVEIDSREYHSSDADWERTLARHNDLTRAGLALLHVSPASVTRPGSTFVPDVAEWLQARAIELGVPTALGRGVVRVPGGGDPAPLMLSALRVSR